LHPKPAGTPSLPVQRAPPPRALRSPQQHATRRLPLLRRRADEQASDARMADAAPQVRVLWRGGRGVVALASGKLLLP
jgi:hypothetical protein